MCGEASARADAEAWCGDRRVDVFYFVVCRVRSPWNNHGLADAEADGGGDGGALPIRGDYRAFDRAFGVYTVQRLLGARQLPKISWLPLWPARAVPLADRASSPKLSFHQNVPRSASNSAADLFLA